MPNYHSVAASVAKRKTLYPERYCKHPGCLWNTATMRCPRHEHIQLMPGDDPSENCRCANCEALRKEIENA